MKFAQLTFQTEAARPTHQEFLSQQIFGHLVCELVEQVHLGDGMFALQTHRAGSAHVHVED